MADEASNKSTTSDQLSEISKLLTEYITVTRRHIAEQEKVNRHLEKLIEDHEGRLRRIEQWRERTEAKLPKRMLEAEAIEQADAATDEEVVTIKKTLAKWGGIALGLWVAAQIVLQPLIQALWRWAVGA